MFPIPISGLAIQNMSPESVERAESGSYLNIYQEAEFNRDSLGLRQRKLAIFKIDEITPNVFVWLD
jgi:hypothetical protein